MYYEPRHCESGTIAVLNYPVGLHYPCFDLILPSRSYFKLSHESSGAADLSLMVKTNKFSGHFVISRCFQINCF